ncbi:XRE family transcriptional regulator [Delftia tsuruhatensis]|uniref:LexA family protein n=1 Tax=Delftia tsuruhatensis TaxID=180282 RepID=UPI00244BDF68|nr:XRE family transcriptional regulator [Delftia tsuruhatensis]MDH0777508.1 XRE family transcriptional regulator [Delftia tsuruhatensis]MDH1824645.1 XRE family transcriptional regulator [Delftia tsuruhatensis]
MSVSTFGERMKALRERRGLSQAQLAETVGISQVSIAKIEKGGATKHAAKIAQALGTTAEELSGLSAKEPANAVESAAFYGAQAPAPVLVPLISSVQAGAWSDIVDRFQPGDAESWLPCPVRHGPNTFCLAVEGESMSNPGGKPSYEPGDVIFVDPGRAAQPGDRVVVRLEHQKQATFKQYLEEDGRKFLRALNPDWKPRLTPIDGEATICGVVIGKWVPEIE